MAAGDFLEVTLARADGASGPPRLAGLAVPGPGGAVILARTYDGVLRLSPPVSPPASVITVAEGVLRGSLYESAERAGADPAVIDEVAGLFARKLDFARDLAPGNRFRLVFRRTITPTGETVDAGALLFAEISGRTGVSRFYAFDDGGRTEFLDPHGQPTASLLLRTPVEGARISSIFGMRFHPIFGYTRMHQGVDFAAPAGTPVVAAGDGVVVEARIWGGYGHWLRIRHAGGLETGYAHLSAYAPGVGPGVAVRQGQVVAFVGESGEATGPHLHYEVWRSGVRIDPADIPSPRIPGPKPARMARFEDQKARIDALLAGSATADGQRPAMSSPLRGLEPEVAAATFKDAPPIRLSPEA